MTRARKNLIDLASTSYYHLIARCVRRAYLCGDDKYTGKNFDHRREWLVERIKFLSIIFAIEIAAYAIMSNHYHLVVNVNKQQALDWTDEEVIERWYQLYNSHAMVDRYVNGEQLGEGDLALFSEIIAKWRERLYDISWFMKNLNEYIARESNKEDNCTGKYWEGRYKSQALLDETAVLRCMAYVDLNPIRANIADTLEESDFTSIQVRLAHLNTCSKDTIETHLPVKHKSDIQKNQPSQLKPFGGSNIKHSIPFALRDYIELLEWSGRLIASGKAGYIKQATPKVLDSLNIEQAHWLESIQRFMHQYSNFAGSKQRLKQQAAMNDVKWYKGAG
jgi:REP element-mobilizing transposase RayT